MPGKLGMMTSLVNHSKSPEQNQWYKRRPLIAGFFLLVQAFLLVFAYRFDFAGLLARPADTSLCLQIMSSKALCNTLAGVPPTMLLLALIVGFLAILKPKSDLIYGFKTKVVSLGQPNYWLAINFVGLALLLAPYFLIRTDISFNTYFLFGTDFSINTLAFFWLIGSVAFTSGLALWITPAIEIIKLLNWKVIAGILILLTLPQLSVLIGDKLWVETFLQEATLELTIKFLRLFGQPVIWDGQVVVGIKDFSVEIGFPCAGVSGIAFSSGAMAAYILSMHSHLNVPRAIVMIPLVAILSWLFNALRIAILMMIGEHISPELAIEGFHSYAGWISFTLLTGAMVFAVDRTPWFQKPVASPRAGNSTTVFNDPVAAQILPFTAFIFSSLVVGAFFEIPDDGYPFRILLVIACLLAFWRCFPVNLNWKIDPISIIAGSVIAAFWLLGQQGSKVPLAEMVPGLTGAALFVWVAVRIFGTSVIVPIIEELFFRGYLLNRLNIGGKYGAGIALVLSSVLFAALHGNLLLAFLAGLMLGALVLKTGRIVSAIYAHAVANGLIGIYALLTDNWSVI